MNFSKRSGHLFITALSMLLFLTTAVMAAEQKAVTMQSKAAEVNGTVITLEDLTGEMNSFRQRMMQQGRILPEAELQGIRKELLNQLIDRELLFQDSKARGISFESDIVQAELTKIKGRFKTEEAFKRMHWPPQIRLKPSCPPKSSRVWRSES